MRSVIALIRASLLSAASYRLNMAFSVLALLASFVPLHFIAAALQPVVSRSIAAEGGEYFGFLIVGLASIIVITAALAAVPGALGGNIATGTLEALFVTRTPLYLIIAGLGGYAILWSLARALVMLAGAYAIGTRVAWTTLPAVALVVTLLIAAYYALGLVAGALVLVFRTPGPLIGGILTASGLLGGVYYSTSVIPSWIQDLSALVPLTYGLRAIRMLLLGNAGFSEVVNDVFALTVAASVLLVAGILAFGAALRHARRAGTLAQY